MGTACTGLGLCALLAHDAPFVLGRLGEGEVLEAASPRPVVHPVLGSHALSGALAAQPCLLLSLTPVLPLRRPRSPR